MEWSYTYAGITVVVTVDANKHEAVEFFDARSGVRHHHFVARTNFQHGSFEICGNTVMFCLYPRGHKLLIEVAVTPRIPRGGEQGWLLVTRRFVWEDDSTDCILKGFIASQSAGIRVL